MGSNTGIIMSSNTGNNNIKQSGYNNINYQIELVVVTSSTI